MCMSYIHNTYEHIPQQLIEVQRELMKLKRELKNV